MTKYLITVTYNDGTKKTFTLSAKKLLTAEKIFMREYSRYLINSYSMSTETYA